MTMDAAQSHLHPLSQAAGDLLVTVPGNQQHTGGEEAPGCRMCAKQAGRGRREPCQNLPDAECHRQGPPAGQTGSPGLFELSKAKLRNHQMHKRGAVLDHQLRARLRPRG